MKDRLVYEKHNTCKAIAVHMRRHIVTSYKIQKVLILGLYSLFARSLRRYTSSVVSCIAAAGALSSLKEQWRDDSQQIM